MKLPLYAFGVGEVLMNLSTGVTGAFWPMYLAQGFAPPGVVAPDGPFTIFAIHAYAALITLLGLVEAVVMWRADARVVRLAIVCLLVGDILHLSAWLPSFFQTPVWNAGSFGTLGIIGTLIVLRLVALYQLRAGRESAR
jgi:hypothetical protein